MDPAKTTAELPADAVLKELEERRDEVRRWSRARAVDSEQSDRIRNLSSVWDPDVVARHVRDAVAAAPLLTDPFPHLIIEPLLPGSAFKALVDSVPSDEFFEGGRHLNLRGLGPLQLPGPAPHVSRVAIAAVRNHWAGTRTGDRGALSSARP